MNYRVRYARHICSFARRYGSPRSNHPICHLPSVPSVPDIPFHLLLLDPYPRYLQWRTDIAPRFHPFSNLSASVRTFRRTIPRLLSRTRIGHVGPFLFCLMTLLLCVSIAHTMYINARLACSVELVRQSTRFAPRVQPSSPSLFSSIPSSRSVSREIV
jgi:hypothetical protein